ncbi:MAG: hypothetical protein ABH851_02375 [Methanobacteriota archaeon]
MNARKIFLTSILALSCVIQVSAGEISNAIWARAAIVICGLYLAFIYIAGALAVLMVAYGGIKWILGSDDPGARKQAKELVIHALVGLIVLIVAAGLVSLISGGELYGCESYV